VSKPSQAIRDASGPCLVLGYDRTDSARWAARWAANELPSNGKLVIVHSCRPLHAPPSPLSTPHERHRFGREHHRDARDGGAVVYVDLTRTQAPLELLAAHAQVLACLFIDSLRPGWVPEKALSSTER
jgi:hypothetical protein